MSGNVFFFACGGLFTQSLIRKKVWSRCCHCRSSCGWDQHIPDACCQQSGVHQVCGPAHRLLHLRHAIIDRSVSDARRSYSEAQGLSWKDNFKERFLTIIWSTGEYLGRRVNACRDVLLYKTDPGDPHLPSSLRRRAGSYRQTRIHQK